MKSATSEQTQLKKTLLNVLSIALWLATVGLGFLTITTVQEAADAQVVRYTFEKIEDQEMGVPTGSGLRRIVNYATIAIGVLVWIGAVVIGGMEYHFKRIGKRNSYRVFAWTIGIELALLGLSLLLRNPPLT